MSERDRSDRQGDGYDEDRFGWPDDDRRESRDEGDRRTSGPGSGRQGPGRVRGDAGGDAHGKRSASPDGDGSAVRVAGLSFTTRELFDLGVAWVALGLAFSFFFFGGATLFARPADLAISLAVSMATVGVGFLLHELAHKVVAVRFGQIAHFRADYGMLVLAVIAGLAGFLFAAPGAVYHRGRITRRENGLIAVAGPVTNVLLVFPFLPLAVLPGPIGLVGSIGATINAVLAAFNMIPFGPLDGRTVLSWSLAVYVPVLLVTLGLSALTLGLFFGFI